MSIILNGCISYNFKVLQLFKTSKNIRITSRLASICYKNNLHIHNYINSISQRTIMYLISTILWSNHVLYVEVSSNKFKPSHPCHLHILFYNFRHVWIILRVEWFIFFQLHISSWRELFYCIVYRLSAWRHAYKRYNDFQLQTTVEFTKCTWRIFVYQILS